MPLRDFSLCVPSLLSAGKCQAPRLVLGHPTSIPTTIINFLIAIFVADNQTSVTNLT